MANISNVDYVAMPGQAQSIRALGQNINSELASVYQSIADMHNSWYGKRYNELVKGFNDVIPKINDLLELVIGKIPFALETIANNYSSADQGTNVVSAQNTAPNKITDLTMPDDVGMKFVTSEVETTKASVLKSFSNATDKMESIGSIYATISWKSEASEAFESEFTTLKTNIIAAFEDLSKQFTELMNATLADIQSAETANTVK